MVGKEKLQAIKSILRSFSGVDVTFTFYFPEPRPVTNERKIAVTITIITIKTKMKPRYLISLGIFREFLVIYLSTRNELISSLLTRTAKVNCAEPIGIIKVITIFTY